MEEIGKISWGSGSSGSVASAVFFDNLSDQPLERMACTPLRKMASITVRVIPLGSDTTILPKPTYTSFFLDLRALSMNLIKSSGGCHFLDPTSASSRNQYPMIRSVRVRT
jgi:hypothetical protein